MPDILTPIRVSELPEVTEVNDSDYLIIDNGNQTSRITSEHFNENASESARHYADEAARSALSAEQYAVAASGSADTAAAKAQESNASAQDSEAWAVGKRAGTDVPSADPTYHNNAKYFAGQAHTSATEASDSADTATEKAAEISAAAAQISENTDDIALLMGDFASVESGMTATRAYAIGDLIIADGQLYRAISKISNGATLTPNTNVVATSVDAEVKRIDAEKADKGGNYPDLTAGNANQLVSDSYISDNAPYMMRPSAGGAEIGNREIDELVGGTVAWNQGTKFTSSSLPPSDRGITVTGANDTAIKLSGTATSNYTRTGWFGLSETGALSDAHLGHRILFSTHILSGSFTGSAYFNQTSSSVTFGANLTIGNSKIFTLGGNAGEQHRLSLTIPQDTVCNDLVFTAICVDLTQMFGSTIADYVYALETATAGAGVSWFKRLFPNDYYAYDAGTLKSVEGVSAHVMRGKNLFDKDNLTALNDVWVNGMVLASGGGNRGVLLPCMPSTTYTVSLQYKNMVDIAVCSFTDVPAVGSTATAKATTPSAVTNKVTTITTGGSDAYLFIKYNNLNQTQTYSNDQVLAGLQVEFGATATDYTPYSAPHTYPLDSSLTLRGIPKLDAANRLYYDGDTYASDGTVTRKYGVVDLGTLNWSRTATSESGKYRMLGGNISGVPTAGTVIPNIRCAKYVPNTGNLLYTAQEGITISTAGTQVVVYDPNYTDAATFKTAMSGVYLVYELATPTTETADSYTNPQIVDNLGTEQYVTTGILPVGHETKYLADLKSKLEVAPDSPDADGDYIMRRTSGENVYAPLASAPAITTLNERKADIDGDYPDMVVGNAEQLVATVGIEDETPYLFRTSGGSIDIGDREEDMLVGGTIAWNQLIGDLRADTVVYGLTLTRTTGNTHIHVVGTATNTGNVTLTASLNVIENHVYYISGGATAIQGAAYGVNRFAGTIPVGEKAVIRKALSSGSTSGFLAVNTGTEIDMDLCPQHIDLTQMFGNAIADYILSLESAHAGDGVAWFRKLFPADYYPYDAGTLMSVENVSVHRMIGFNQCNSALEFGNINASGNNDGSSKAYIRTKDYIKTVPGQTYCFYANDSEQFLQLYVLEYDAGYRVLSRTSLIGGNVLGTEKYATCPLKANTAYVRMFIYRNQQFTSVDNAKFCISLVWDGERNGEYEAYKEYNYPLDSSVVLRGIPKLDGNNSLYYDGDTYESDGTVTRKYGIVDMGTLTYTKNSGAWRATISDRKYAGIGGGYIDSRIVGYAYDFNLGSDMTYAFSTANNGYVWFRNDTYTTADAFKAAMSGVMLVYELATPTTETADPYSNPQIVDDWGTEEYVTDSIVPVGHQTIYQANLRAKLEMSPDSPEGDGDYIVRQTNGENSYVPLVIPTELPTMPSENGTYVLKVTVVNGTPTLAWVTE